VAVVQSQRICLIPSAQALNECAYSWRT
jgi:hypothetical protein